MSRLLVCTLLLSSLLAGISAQNAVFPKLTEIFKEFFESSVEITDLNQQASAFVNEYYDNITNRGRIEIMTYGDKQSIFYYNETDEIVEVNSTHCLVWQTDESQFFYYELFYGWLRKKDPLIIGPSALFWYANDARNKLTYDNQEDVRGIKCDKFTYVVKNDRDDFNISYYFAITSWTTPYQLKGLRVPIRVELNGWSSREASKVDTPAPVNQIIDFVYFKTVVTSDRSFQPPIGLGCPLRKATIDMPGIPKVFKFSVEAYDLLAAGNKDESDVNFYQVWYHRIHKMARLDAFDRTGFTSSLYDFHKGVTYVQKNGQTCSIQSLLDSFFEGYDYDKAVGYFKDPEEVLGLLGDFYYMGENEIRGIKADVFESARLDAKIGVNKFYKVVTTVYFTKEFMQVAVEGETETQVPIYILITVYEEPGKVIIKRQYNIFGFDDVVWPAMYTSFQLPRCFPLANQKSYFLLIMNANPALGRKMEGQNDMLMQQLKNKVAVLSNVTEQRIPFLKADYKESGVYVTGLMLDRPPLLKQFWTLGISQQTTAHELPKAVPDATTIEDCAVACIEEKVFVCTGFYFCGKDCFIKKGSIMDEAEGDTAELGKCTAYFRAERDSIINEVNLIDALKRLEQAVINQSLILEVKIDEKTEELLPVQDVIIGEGPFTGGIDDDTPYEIVFSGFQIPSDVGTTEVLDDVDTLNGCYRGCKDSESLACTSFSYCSKAENKRCRISSLFIRKTADNKNFKDIEPSAECNVYSLKYLDSYEALSGKVVMVPGDKLIKAISSTEECAKNCRTETAFTCRGFEFCRKKKNCVLHSKHVLDLKGGDITDSTQTECVHYSAKFSADFLDKGDTLVDDDSNKRVEITFEECARACSEEMKTCKSFNFCPASEPYMTDSSCSLTTKTLLDNNVKTTKKDKCRHYTKKKDVEDWATSKSKNFVDPSGWTSKGFGGLVVGMLALGLILGVLGFIGYSYFRSKSSDEGMTVRFMKQADT